MTEIERSGAVCEIRAHLMGARKRAIGLILDPAIGADGEPELTDPTVLVMSAILTALGTVEDLEYARKDIERRKRPNDG